MSNSKLVSYTRISPNSTNPRRNKIRKITIHHTAGVLSLQTIGNVFAPKSRNASSNYGVDSQGRVGMYVEEKNCAWTSSSLSNDHQAVTIEVSNSQVGGQWKVSDAALKATIELCIDICKRNGIKKLNYTGDASGNLTRHNMFSATTCPGPYLQSKFPYIAREVNKALGNKPKSYLSSGDKGNDVKKLQQDLMALGYSLGSYGADGVYGNDTVNAVKKFQKDNKLTVDGIAGITTLGKIDELLNKEEKIVEYELKEIKLNIHGKEEKVEGIYQNHTNYVPIRLLEELGYDIDWKVETVIVTYKGD